MRVATIAKFVRGLALLFAGPLAAQTLTLPSPVRDPLAIDSARDPVLGFATNPVSNDAFRATINGAVLRAPVLGEAVAQRQESEAARNEARTRQYPGAELSLSHFEVVSRAFSNDPQNILERQRPQFRTDGILRITQPLFDFGASSARIRAGNARLQAAAAAVEDTGTRVAVQAIAAWYNVFAYRALVRLAESAIAGQGVVRSQVEDRIRMGASARGDMAQVDSAIAASTAQLADFRRSLASAEAQFAQILAIPLPAAIGRAPSPDMAVVPGVLTPEAVDALPNVRSARAQARAAEAEARAARGEALPGLSAGLDAGRYGILQNARDYDVRASVTLSWRPFGGAKQRVDQAEARAAGAEARYQRTREEAERDARIAIADVAGIGEESAALAASYLASRTSRDVLTERFRVARGTLIDVLNAEASLFNTAARYVLSVTELDTARYTLLARTGKLLEALAITPAALDPK
jgi:outer membrane protein, adhesin transport system